MDDGGNLPSESGVVNRIEPVQWRGVRAIEKLILIALPLAALAVVALPFMDQVIARRLARLPGARPVVVWLVNGQNAWIVGAALLGLTALIALFVRYRLMSNKRLWSGNGCPDCMERELVRVSRKTSDRFYKLIGVPAYRYACRNCTWRGLRIARRDISPERLAELEASMARFDPDSMQAFKSNESDGAEDLSQSPNRVPPNGPSSLFHDPGDVDRIPELSETSSGEILIDDDELIDELMESPETANHSANGETTDGMEWLWRRSSD